MSNGISIEKLKAKLGEKEVQILLYEQLIEQYQQELKNQQKGNEGATPESFEAK